MTTIKFVNLKKQYSKLKSEIDSIIQEVINNTAFINGKYVNEFKLIYKNKNYYYEGIPLTIFKETNFDIDHKYNCKKIFNIITYFI